MRAMDHTARHFVCLDILFYMLSLTQNVEVATNTLCTCLYILVEFTMATGIQLYLHSQHISGVDDGSLEDS